VVDNVWALVKSSSLNRLHISTDAIPITTCHLVGLDLDPMAWHSGTSRNIDIVLSAFALSLSLFSDAFDNELIVKTLWDILEGQTVQIPVYDFVTHSRSVVRTLTPLTHSSHLIHIVLSLVCVCVSGRKRR
jgi:hypothetical protein